jgi:dTMP kinase
LSLIVLEGIDKSGKATQTRLLMKRLKKHDKEVQIISFPDYSTTIGELIRKYLDNKVKLNPEVRQCLYVANRWERVQDIKSWIEEGNIIIADRYIPSGLAYGIANGLELEWMINLEKGLPTPDLVIVVDVPVETAFDRENTRDVYERDKKFLTRVRQAYLYLAQTFHWVVVDGEKPRRDVTNQIWKQIKKIIE